MLNPEERRYVITMKIKQKNLKALKKRARNMCHGSEKSKLSKKK